MKRFEDFGIYLQPAASGEVDVTCPECSAQRKKKNVRCLSVNVDKETWVCHHCGWSGGLSDGAYKHETHWRAPPRRPTPLPKASPTTQAQKWLEGRGIPADVLERNGVVCVEAYMPQIEGKARCVVFPYLRDGETINRKYRDGKKNFRLEAGCERVLFGLDDLEPECPAVIVEGEVDKLSCEVAGFPRCVSVPDGAPPANAKDYASKFAFLDADEERIRAVSEWIIAVDADEPGERLEDELARRLGRERCRRVRWPEGCKDANDVLVKHGGASLRKCLEDAAPYPIKGVFDVMDLSDRIDRLYEQGWDRGVSTGWLNVDGFYTVRPGELTVVTGIPNSGKSEFMDALLVNLAKKHGWQFAVFSPENQPIEDHMARFIEKWAEEPFVDGPMPRMSLETMTQGKSWLTDHFKWILPDDDDEWTIETVLESARALVFQQGIRGLVIDPWNELEHLRPEGMTETEYTSQVLKRIRQFARRNGVHVWVVAHPTKLYREKGGGYPVPTLYDISGSAHWRNKTDNGLVIWRNFKDIRSAVEIHIQKIRFRQIGRVGMAELSYNRAVGVYRAIA